MLARAVHSARSEKRIDENPRPERATTSATAKSAEDGARDEGGLCPWRKHGPFFMDDVA